MPRPAGCAWTMTDNKPDDGTISEIRTSASVLPNGFISRQTERQNVLRMTPIP
ncbi:MAG: hypothetical protein ACLRRJ_01955 [Clostridium sp.]